MPPQDSAATLYLYADTESANRSELGLSELWNAQVGHAWVGLDFHDKTKIPDSVGTLTKGLLQNGKDQFGFWPLIADNWDAHAQRRVEMGQTPGGGASQDQSHTGFSLTKEVPGRVEEPDDSHAPKIKKPYPLTEQQVVDLMTYVNSKRSSNYHLSKYNCSNFAVEAAQAAGQAPPTGIGLMGACLPNGLYRDLYQKLKAGDKTVIATPLEQGEKHE
jgi:hypothetical protein